MAQFFHSKTVVNSILLVVKARNFMKKDSIKDLTLPVQYIEACPDIIIKTSKCLPTLKIFLPVEINSGLTEAAARSCSLKTGIVEIFEKFARDYFCWSL